MGKGDEIMIVEFQSTPSQEIQILYFKNKILFKNNNGKDLLRLNYEFDLVNKKILFTSHDFNLIGESKLIKFQFLEVVLDSIRSYYKHYLSIFTKLNWKEFDVIFNQKIKIKEIYFLDNY